MNRKSSTVLIGSAVLGIIMLLVIYMGLIVTGVIDTRPSELVIIANSAEKEYDGEPLICHEYTIKRGELKKGHEIIAEYDAELTNTGSCENIAHIKVVDSLGADVTNHYRLETRPGSLTVVPRKLVLRSGDAEMEYADMPLTCEEWEVATGEIPEGMQAIANFSGEQITPGSSKNTFAVTIRNKQGESVDRNFAISYLYGTLTVTKKPLTVTSFGATKIYDGLPLTCEEYTVDGDLASYMHEIRATFSASITDVGSMTNNISVLIMSGSVNVTSYYDISVRVGSLEVKPRPIEISASPCIKHFSGSQLPEGEWYLTKGSLVEGHVISAEVEAIKNSEDTVEFLLRNVAVLNRGFDVSSNYEISLVHGIDRDQLEKLEISSGSKAAPYTGEPLTFEQYVLSAGALEPGHVIEAYFTGSQTEVGFSDNTFTVAIVDQATGEDVTYRYDIEYKYGTLEIFENAPSTGGEIGDDGSLDNNVQNEHAVAARVWAQQSGRVYLRWKSYGNYSFRSDAGNWGWGDAMAYPNATYNMLHSTGRALAANGKTPVQYDIEILGNQYLIPNYTAQGPEGAYNDVMLSPFTTAYTLSGYAWSYSYADALRYAAAGLEDEQNKAYTTFVYSQYLDVPEATRQALLEIAEQNGLKADCLSIIEDVASFVRSAAKYEMEYPTCPAGQDEVIYFLTDSKSGVCRHFASAATLLYRTLGIPARYVVGYNSYASANTWTEIKGADAHAWVEVFITGLGWVRIDPTPAYSGDVPDDALVLALTKVMGYYTGLPYTATQENVMIMQGALQSGHVLSSVEVSGSRIEVGTSVSVIGAVVIVDANGVDVTDQYTIVRRDGVIEVRKPTLTVTAASAKKIYDGGALTAQTFTHSFKNTQLGALYTVTATVSGAQTEIGQSANEIGEVVITDVLGRDVTDNFDVQRVRGTLKVYLYELALQTSGATAQYNGKPLQADEIIYDRTALQARGHELEYSMPSIVNVGYVSNTPTVKVLDSSGKDVTAEYDLRVNAGVLRIKPVALTLQTDSASKVYDGRALSVDGYTLIAGELVQGQSITSYQISGSQTNVGVSEATVTAIRIKDEHGKDVTANYQITILPGTLTVLAP